MKARRQLSRELFIPPSPDRVALVCLHCLCGRITCHEGTTCLTKKRSRPACFYPKCLVQGARRLTTDLHCAWGPQTSSNGSWYFLEDRSGRFGLETNALGRANSCKTCISRPGMRESQFCMCCNPKALENHAQNPSLLHGVLLSSACRSNENENLSQGLRLANPTSDIAQPQTLILSTPGGPASSVETLHSLKTSHHI